jgi:hypothetical protein
VLAEVGHTSSKDNNIVFGGHFVHVESGFVFEQIYRLEIQEMESSKKLKEKESQRVSCRM